MDAEQVTSASTSTNTSNETGQQEEIEKPQNDETKKGQKKKQRYERLKQKWDKKKEAKKQKQKEEKEKKIEERRMRIQNMTEEEQQQERERLHALREARKREKQETFQRVAEVYERPETVPSVVIDCSFDHLMTDKEITSLSQQLMYCYSSNIHSPTPFHLCFTSLNGRLEAKLQKLNCQHWKAKLSADHFSTLFPPEKTVYLSADSENELTTIEPGTAYVIGGIVDRNRHKGLCFTEAQKHNVQTAKFPIANHIKLGASAILTVNHCVDILYKYVQTNGDWKAALEAVVPKRKRGREDSEQSDETEESSSPVTVDTPTASSSGEQTTDGQ